MGGDTRSGRLCAWGVGIRDCIGGGLLGGGGGRLPLSTSDQFGQPSVERPSGVGVWGPVGPTEDPGVCWTGDMPTFFVDPPVVDSA